jgi:hypothetical protein
MPELTWGLIGPEELISSRRTRTLGLGSAVRTFNDLAVPGLGGIWFGRQLFLAALGIAVAQHARDRGLRIPNIPVTNAVEALACWLAFNETAWSVDPRLRGGRKMRTKHDLSFAAVRKPTFYVTQPMRSTTIQPLLALGFVHGNSERFNAFECTEAGFNLIELFTEGQRPHRKTVTDLLSEWVRGAEFNMDTSALRDAISPTRPLAKAVCDYLYERLSHGVPAEAERRKSCLAWVNQLRNGADVPHLVPDACPPSMGEQHWRDIIIGAQFFEVRNAALKTLDQIEGYIAARSEQRVHLNDSDLRDCIVPMLDALKTSAERFLSWGSDPTPDRVATKFCKECLASDERELLAAVIGRDGRTVMLQGDFIIPGPAFDGGQSQREPSVDNPEDAGAEVDVASRVPVPAGASFRLRNLYLLSLDLTNELDRWLTGAEGQN